MTRTRIATRKETLPNGTIVERRRIVEAPVLEWRLQSAQVRVLRSHRAYGRKFLLVGGMEAGKRGPQDAVRAKATGLTAGHPDLTIFILGGKAKFIENKAAKGRLSPVQKERHAALKSLGFDVVVIQVETEIEAVEAAVKLVKSWIAEPANQNVRVPNAISES